MAKKNKVIRDAWLWVELNFDTLREKYCPEVVEFNHWFETTYGLRECGPWQSFYPSGIYELMIQRMAERIQQLEREVSDVKR